MHDWFRNTWDSLQTSFWFVPSFMLMIAIFLSALSVYLDDQEYFKDFRELAWVWAGGASGSREMLSTIAGSMMAVTGVTFSITIVAMTLAANQFGPWILRNFMRDRGNQVVLGTFISTFTYSLLVLGRVRQENNGSEAFVPYISITIAIVLVLASLGILIFFIHHVAHSLQAENMIAAISRELQAVLQRLYPEKLGLSLGEEIGEEEGEKCRKNQEGRSVYIRSRKSGYLQTVESRRLLDLCIEKNILVRLFHRPGAFILKDAVVMEVWPLTEDTGDLGEDLAGKLIIGKRRTPVQDVEYPMHQLVEVALRALSPSLNDPYTAIASLDRLAEALLAMARRKIPSLYRYDEQKKLRIITDRTTFRGMADIAFDQIRESSAGNVEIIVRMLHHIGIIAEQAIRDEDKHVLQRHAELIRENALKNLETEYNKDKIEDIFNQVIFALAGTKRVFPTLTKRSPDH
jgi:uncharacterized membrane protein